ncbi:hypothetical protein ABZ093_23535 [Streptomyces cyaneofuscatus]|uniref:hypothetical protein n=1 Tax=Streptomyces cyaneofuscatus TaxID=66883 RepID=UPI0033A4C3FB
MQTEERAPGRAAAPSTYRWAAVGCAVLAGAIGWTDALAVVGRAVVREASFLLAGSGQVFAVGTGGVGWKPMGSWTADDGIRPIAAGSYELKWAPKEGTLLIHGSNANPVWPALHGVSCG